MTATVCTKLLTWIGEPLENHAFVLPKECQRRRSPTPQSDIIAGVAKISDRMSGKWGHLENSDHKSASAVTAKGCLTFATFRLGFVLIEP
jgi:hypothetical protein